jgi:hypothetical protein
MECATGAPVQNLLEVPSGRRPSDARRTPDTTALQFSVTGYSGHENEILQLLNANRPVAMTRRWLDWRYAQTPGVPAPRVFWIKYGDQPPVGMASLIFRRYWVNGEPREMAVLGDISLSKKLRGQGLGRELMDFIGRHLSSWPQHAAFAIPALTEEGALTGTGWTTAGLLVPHVFMVDPTEKLSQFLRSASLARGLSAVFKRVVATGLRLSNTRKLWLQFVDDVDETFDTFWLRFPKRNMILRDMSQETLRWRYMRHPDAHFRIAKLMSHEGLEGYTVFEVGRRDPTCRIRDVIVKRRQDVRRMLMLFVQHFQTMGSLNTFRLVIADGHPYAHDLWKAGFVKRPPQGVFQVRSAAPFHQCAWHITSGDQDV